MVTGIRADPREGPPLNTILPSRATTSQVTSHKQTWQLQLPKGQRRRGNQSTLIARPPPQPPRTTDSRQARQTTYSGPLITPSPRGITLTANRGLCMQRDAKHTTPVSNWQAIIIVPRYFTAPMGPPDCQAHLHQRQLLLLELLDSEWSSEPEQQFSPEHGP